MSRKLAAEFLGTFALVFLAVGSAVVGINTSGKEGVALAFGFVLAFCVYAIGPVSGSHVNPAVTLAMVVGRGMAVAEGLAYMAAQVAGAVLGAFGLWLLVDLGVMDETGGLGANSYGPATGGATGAFILETVLTALFVWVVLLVTDKAANAAMAGIGIGAALAAVHLVGVSVTGTSVNPARSIGPALFSGADAMKQLWLFILAPLVGGLLAVLMYRVSQGAAAKVSGAAAEPTG